MSIISDNIASIKENIKSAALRAGRDPGGITLVAVSKTVDTKEILDAYDNAGQIDFGENRVQELVRKYDERFNWHMIGHLQKNKVKYIVGKVKLIHSVDSIELMDEIEKCAFNQSKIVSFLLEVNISGEKSKFGVSLDAVLQIAMKMSQYRNITLQGLMTMAPNITDRVKIREIFRQLHDVYVDIKNKNIHNVNMKYLSMGMSNDYEVAVEEGANLVRIGTSVFTKAENV